MNLSSIVDTVEILNIEKELSKISSNAQILSSESGLDKSHYIISDADQELLILIQFKQAINLKSIKLYASMDNINDIDQDEIDDISLPKQVYIYKLTNLNVNFDDLESLKPINKLNVQLRNYQKDRLLNYKKIQKCH